MGPQALAIEVRALRKSFGSQVVLDGLDLAVPTGTVFALLGSNGAGKTTAIHVLTTLLRPDSGEVRVGGFDVAREPDAVRRLIGLTGQVSAVDTQFTGEENLRLVADLHHLGRARAAARVAELIERFDLGAVARQPVQSWSGGLRRRLDLAMTLVGEPRVIFLDEPTTGLDPRSRRTMWETILGLAAAGVTIFLTTQYLEEAERLASRVALIDGGRIVAEGRPGELRRQVPGGTVRLEFPTIDALDLAARRLAIGTRDDRALTLEIPYAGDLPALRSLLASLDPDVVGPVAIDVRSAALDDVFLALTGRAGHPEEVRR